MVHDFFKDCGTVLEVILPKHKETKETRGFAIVMFGTEAAVVSALKLDRDPFHGGNVSVMFGVSPFPFEFVPHIGCLSCSMPSAFCRRSV